MLPTIATGNVASALAGEYEVANSLRFDDGSSDYLSQTFSGAGNQRTFTISFWFKRSNLVSGNVYTYQGEGNEIRSEFTFFNDYLKIVFNPTGSAWSSDMIIQNNGTNILFRDVSAWYHVVLAIDTTQSTEANRIKPYVNGVLQSMSAYPTLNFDTGYNTAIEHGIGTYIHATNTFFDGYFAEFCVVDGQQLDATSFGEFDSDTNIWKPIDVSGLTFGTNGFYLDFENSGSLGADVSGNGNNFTVNNLTSIDQTTDTCTNNFATMNPLDLGATTGGEFAQGNLDVHMGGTAQGVYYSTIGVSSGKWVMEVNPDSGSGGNSYIGISGNANNSRGANDLLGDLAFDYGFYQSNGTVRNNDSDSAYGSSYSNGNIIGVYLDLDNNKLYFSINGTVQNSGTGISISDVSNTPIGNYFFCVGDDNAFAERRFNVNFGNPIETISSGNTDGEFGNFEYTTTITGDGVSKTFKALCTKNLAEYG